MNSYTCLLHQATLGIKTSLGTKEWTNRPPSPPADRDLYVHLHIQITISKTLFKTKGQVCSKSAYLSSVLGDFAQVTGFALIQFWRNALTAKLYLRRCKYFLRNLKHSFIKRNGTGMSHVKCLYNEPFAESWISFDLMIMNTKQKLYCIDQN